MYAPFQYTYAFTGVRILIDCFAALELCFLCVASAAHFLFERKYNEAV